MNTLSSTNPAARATAQVLALAALFGALPSQAQYKVVGPDGKVTYTDRPPVAPGNKITTVTAGSGGGSPAASLPLELRQPVARYPVSLYVTANCEPCDAGRQLLRQRGVPYTEKLVQTADDSDALQRLSGSRDAPTVMIGTQAVRGFAADLWNSYLDAAAYPRESRLPPGYQFPAATPLTERKDTAEAAAQRVPGANLRQDPPPAPPADTGPRIRF